MPKKAAKPFDHTAELLRQIRDDIAEMKTELSRNTTALGSMAQSLVGVQRDMRDVKREIATLSLAVDEHTRRLDRIDERLGLNDPTH